MRVWHRAVGQGFRQDVLPHVAGLPHGVEVTILVAAPRAVTVGVHRLEHFREDNRHVQAVGARRRDAPRHPLIDPGVDGADNHASSVRMRPYSSDGAIIKSETYAW